MALRQKPVIAITGSAGKSTTKEMISAILARKWKIVKSTGNLNFYTHTRNYAKQYRTGNYRAAVLEYGMSQAGHIKTHCSILQPDVAVVTNIGTAHLGNFGGDVKKLIRAKSELIRFMRPSGIAIYNIDDANSRAMPHGRFNGTLVTVGITRKADYMAKNVQYGTGGMRFDVILHGKQQSFFIPIYGTHQVYNALCAIAVADRLGFTAEHMRAGLRTFKRMRSRLAIYQLNGKARLIDDSFSANPNAVKAALDVLDRLARRNNSKRVAVLGTMLALGAYTQKGHRDVGAYAAKKQVDVLYTYGKFTDQIGKGAIQAGLSQQKHRHFTSRKALHKELRSLLKENCVILVKGSHGAGMTETSKFLISAAKNQKQKA